MESHYVICLFLSGWKVDWTDNARGVLSVFLYRDAYACVCVYACMFTTLWLTLLCRQCVCACVCGWVWSTTQQCSAFHLEQQLVLHDPLDGFDEQVVELQPVAQLLPQLLTAKTDRIIWHHSTLQPQHTQKKQQLIANNPSKTIYHRDYTVCLFVLCLPVNEEELITIWIINGSGKDINTAMYNI